VSIDKNKLPPRTVERLSKYRRLLSKFKAAEEHFIFSHDLAHSLNLTSVQVRRDLMLIGISGNHRRGYQVNELMELISTIIDTESGQNIAIVGMGNLGAAVTNFIKKSDTKMNILAGFDIDVSKVGKEVAEVKCYHINTITEKIIELNIEIAVLTVSTDAVVDITKLLVEAGIRGILNFTSVHLDVPNEVYLKNYDIITSLEEIGFFIKQTPK
jgi:redox-sensing transcriptional repressor